MKLISISGKIISFTTEIDDGMAKVESCERFCNRTVPLEGMLQIYCEANVDKLDRFNTDIRWYKDGEPLPLKVEFDEEMHYSVDSYILDDYKTGTFNRHAFLKIKRTNQYDSAKFTCSSRKNSEEYDNVTVSIMIVDVPKVVVNVTVVAKTSRSVELAWDTSLTAMNSSFVEFVFEYKTVDESWKNDARSMIVKSNENGIEITELRPATSYNVRVYTKNDYFPLNPFEMVITTDGQKPSGQPQIIKVESTSPYSLRIFWKAPPKSEWNGALLGFYLGFRFSNPPETPFFYEKIDSDELNEDKEYSSELTGLKPNSQYSIIVQAFNRFGDGPSSDKYNQFTMKSIPSSQDWNIECTPLHPDSLGISWNIENALPSYRIRYAETELSNNTTERKEDVWTTKTYVMLSELKSHTNYTIQVLATTLKGDNEESDPIHCATLDGKLIYNKPSILVFFFSHSNPFK